VWVIGVLDGWDIFGSVPEPYESEILNILFVSYNPYDNGKSHCDFSRNFLTVVSICTSQTPASDVSASERGFFISTFTVSG